MGRTKPFDLSALLNTAGTGDFLAAHWPDTLYVGHGARARLGGLFRIPALKNGAAFMKVWKGTASAWPRLGKSDALLTIQSRDLAKFHRAGYTLYFTSVEDTVPEVKPFLRRIERDLGLRRGDMTCEAILSRKGSGAVPHFDADCTFNLQIEGKKLWRVTTNTSVSYPHKAGMMRDAMHPEMAGYASQPFPSSMPPEAQTFITTAGSVTFLPHGTWHGTECLADSFAIAFVVPGPKWFQLFTGEVEAELLKFTQARQLSMIGPDAHRQTATVVLERLRNIVNGMDVERLLKRWAGPPAFQFRRLTPKKSPPVEKSLKPLMKWVSDGPDVFSAFDAIDAFPHAESGTTLKALFKLVEAGVIELA